MATSLLSGVSNPTFMSRGTKDRFDRFLIISHKSPNERLSKKNPFFIDKALKDILGKKFYQVKPMSSGNLLIEVDLKQSHEKLLTVRKLRDIPVTVKAHSSLNQCKGKVFCDAMDNMKVDYLKDQLKDQNVTEMYRPE